MKTHDLFRSRSDALDPQTPGMAASSPLTLRDFFLTPESGWEARFAEIAEGQEASPAFGLDQIDRGLLVRHVADRLHDALEVGLGQIMVRAWGRYRSMREHLDASRQQPDEVLLVPLADHTIRSTHHPAVELMANDRRVASFKFAAELALHMRGVVLRVIGGQVATVESGAWRGEGQLKFGQAVMVEQSTTEFALPGALDFTQRLSDAPANIRPPAGRRR